MRTHLLPTTELLLHSHSRCGNNRIKVLQLAIDARARRKLYVNVMTMLRRFLKSYSVKTLKYMVSTMETKYKEIPPHVSISEVKFFEIVRKLSDEGTCVPCVHNGSTSYGAFILSVGRPQADVKKRDI